MRRAYTAVTRDEDDVDADIELRACYKDRKLFFDDQCPVCMCEFAEYAVFNSCGHVVCGACAVGMLAFSQQRQHSYDTTARTCPMCRERGDVTLHEVDDAAYKRAMRSAGTMAPRLRAEAANAAAADAQCAQSVRYGTAVSEDGLNGIFVEIQAAQAAHAAQVPRMRRTFVVVDVSGSMAPVIPSIDLGPLVASLVGTWLCIVTFGTEVDTIYEGVVAAGDVAPNLFSDGTTNLHGALDHVRRKIEACGEDCREVDGSCGFDGAYDVMIVTDGEPDNPDLAVLAMRALKETARASVYLVGTGPSYVFANCSRLLDFRTHEFEHAEPDLVCGALTSRGCSGRVRVAGAPESRMYYNGAVTAPVDGVHAFFARNGAAHVVFTGLIDLETMLVDGNLVAARHDAALGYRVRGALLSMTAIARVKKACFDLDAPAVARMHTLRDTERELAEYEATAEFPGCAAIVEMIDGAKRGIVDGAEAERLHSTSVARSVTAIGRACTC
jgi:hypothetical protein